MTIPTTFGGLTQATGAELDGNFAFVGALGIQPCTITGTNTLALAPTGAAIAITAYANYQKFAGIAAGSNTGAVTATVGSIGALNVYKDTATGPVGLTGGEIVANNYITLTYDALLNSGNGGFHLQAFGAPSGIASLAAAGASQSTATLLPAAFNIITTVPVGSGVIASPYPGVEQRVVNEGALTVLIYPPIGAAFNGGTANVAVSANASSVVFIFGLSATDWRTK